MGILVRLAAHHHVTVSCQDDIISVVETIITNQWNWNMAVKYYHTFSNEIIITPWPSENHRLVQKLTPWPHKYQNSIGTYFQCIFSPSKTKSEKIMTIEITFSKKEPGFGLLIDHFHPDHTAVFPVAVISKMMLLWPHSTDGQFSWTSEWKTRLPFKLKAQMKILSGRIRTTGIF